MRIPKDSAERENLYDEVIKQCEKSQQDRRDAADKFRMYYLYGSDDDEDEVPFNKIYPHLDTVLSFMFASETAKFSVTPAPGEVETEHLRTGIFGDAINEKWHQSNADIVVSNAILWALVFNTMVVKVLPQVNQKTKALQINPCTVHPAAFGVYREDIPFFSRQQAMVQTYYQLEDEVIENLGAHPDKEAILAKLTPATNQEETQATSAMTRIMMGSWQPVGNATMASGNATFNLSADMGYQPEQIEGLVMMKELWIWDDELNDYRVVTRTQSGGFSIHDRPNPYLNGEHPFVQFCPRPLPFYVWGESEVGGLVGLQRWRNEYIKQIRQIIQLQVKPPTAVSGFGLVEEALYAKFVDGSFLNESTGMGMNAKVERFAPSMPQDIYRIVNEIDNSFNEYSGLPNTVQGKGEVGVRSGKQANELARLGSARIKKRALIIEDALEKMAHLYAQLMQKHDTTTYADRKGEVFVLSQFTKQYEVKVDSHSSSPVFVEDKRDLAASLLNMGLITPERAIEMIDPPDKQAILHELPQIKAQKAQSAQADADAELKKEALKHAPEGFMQKFVARLFNIQ